VGAGGGDREGANRRPISTSRTPHEGIQFGPDERRSADNRNTRPQTLVPDGRVRL